MARLDPHSYADAAQPGTTVLHLDLTVDFEAQVLRGTATLELERPAEGALDLDTRDLDIQAVTDGEGHPLGFTLHPAEGFMGSRLTIEAPGDRVQITYATRPTATALQWLAPAQTAGGAHPYVFTQCQAIHARSVTPCQDTPRVRQEVQARLTIPRALTAVMAAADLGREESGDVAVQRFHMPQRIPSYLLAFAVGHLTSEDVGARTRVWAEPEAVKAAAWEFAEVDAMLTAAEGLFGPYPWDRFDLLLMPPSFPYGGMENPRLTFLTPTLLAGDRSLVSVVAHELAHSWTGNLVTNASMNDFWLNEGFTVYAERRIVAALEGEASWALHAALGRRGLEADVARLSAMDPALTRLANDLTGVDPDEVYSLVPYEKGFLFLVRVEAAVGRAAFDRFIARYIERFAFTSITTRDLLTFMQAELPELAGQVDLETWIHGTGIPTDAPAARSERLDALTALAGRFSGGGHPDAAALEALDATEWQVLLSLLPNTLPEATCQWLDATFQLTDKRNAEILVAWLALATRSGHRAVWPKVAETLKAVGRGKYLRPLYSALVSTGDEGRAFAREIFEAAKGGYHPVGRALAAGIVGA
jgi:leukotriene-A4 hydrolase